MTAYVKKACDSANSIVARVGEGRSAPGDTCMGHHFWVCTTSLIVLCAWLG